LLGFHDQISYCAFRRNHFLGLYRSFLLQYQQEAPREESNSHRLRHYYCDVATGYYWNHDGSFGQFDVPPHRAEYLLISPAPIPHLWLNQKCHKVVQERDSAHETKDVDANRKD
jgi:hypothetical protein